MKVNLFKMAVLLTALTCKLFGQVPQTTTMLVEGIYTGKNLLIKNSDAKPYGFCIIEIKANGQITPANITADIVEVPLNLLHKEGDSVKVEIRYKLACSPKIKPSILNPGALLSFQSKMNPNENRLLIDGEFHWGTLLIINPYNSANKTYCIKEIKINGKPFNIELNKEIISVDISKLGQPTVFNSEEEEKAAKAKGGFKEGERLQIEIVYSKDSDPTILNPDLITPWTTKN